MVLVLSLSLLTISTIISQKDAIHRQTANRKQFNTHYEYIVVGAGSGGCVVANRLSADTNNHVLLLEAGGPPSFVDNDIPGIGFKYTVPYVPKANIWDYYNEPQKNAGHKYLGHRIMEVKGKTLGGSSSINLMVYNRGNRKEFDNLVNTYGADGWSYSQILQFFIKAENNSDQNIVRNNPGFHGTDGPLGVSTASDPPKILIKLLKTYNKLGFKTVDINGAQNLGTAITQSTIKDGLRSSTSNAYIDPNPYPNRLHILTEALVTKILTKKSMNKLMAFGVEFIKDNKLYRVMATKEVILSAGPINSPQILMLSGIGPKEHLKSIGIETIANLPVGDNYANHIGLPLLCLVNDPSMKQPVPQLNVKQLSDLIANRSGALSELPNSIIYLNTKNNLDKSWPNVHIFGTVGTLLDKTLLYMTPTLGLTRSRGTVRLRSSNPYDSPLIDPQYLTHPKDFEDLIEATKFTLFVLKNTSFAKYVTEISKFLAIGCPVCRVQPIYECEPYIRCLIKSWGMSFLHPVGTCRMGAINRTDVVVDHRLRVKNVFNLRVCDSSVFPEPINANTNAATIMVGEKCSHMVLEDREKSHH